MKERPEIEGIVIVDKPPGMTSAGVVAKLKKMSAAKKVGHTGTLDPFATGVLICCLNRATRLARFFLHGEKTYRGELVLGVETDTQDGTGEVISRCKSVKPSPEQISTAFNRFKGAIEQKPPIYSALKHQGVPLYKLARSGKPHAKPPRRVVISSIAVLGIDFPRVRFEVACSAGTYIRSLCADIGQELGCGAYLEKLTRVESCGFSISQATDLEELEKLALSGNLSDNVIRMAEALPGMSAITADRKMVEDIRHGRSLTKKRLAAVMNESEAPSASNFIKVIDAEGSLLAVLQNEEGQENFRYDCVLIR